MKKQSLKLVALVLGLGSLSAQKQEDIKSIKAMAGCYEISFNFAETFSPNKDYEKHKDYHSGGTEWVTIAEETPNKIVLQHILVVDPSATGKDAVVKHWRQDWTYQNTDFYKFYKGNQWKYVKLTPEQVKGQWTQTVYQVDDAPRYSASGSWVHIDGKNYWETNSDAPLPRREYTTRKDYNVLNRTNRQEIFSWGWLHNQDNKKVLRTDGAEDVVITEEKGLEYYKKVDDSKCLPAQNFWKEYAPLWKTVRTTWENRLNKKTDLKVKDGVKDTHLYTPLMELKPNQHEEAKKLVEDYIVK